MTPLSSQAATCAATCSTGVPVIVARVSWDRCASRSSNSRISRTARPYGPLPEVTGPGPRPEGGSVGVGWQAGHVDADGLFDLDEPVALRVEGARPTAPLAV